MIDVSDGLAFTDAGQEYALKWPKSKKKVVPDPAKAQTLEEAFQWPVKAKTNLQKLIQELPGHLRPVLLSGRELSVASSFSGICSQSRGALVLQAHNYGCNFKHISFCEKRRECQIRLIRDFPCACIFVDQMNLVSIDVQSQLLKAKGFEETIEVLKHASFNSQAPCCRHNSLCSLPVQPDLCLFGAPCVDDSSMGKMGCDDGSSRRVTQIASITPKSPDPAKNLDNKILDPNPGIYRSVFPENQVRPGSVGTILRRPWFT